MLAILFQYIVINAFFCTVFNIYKLNIVYVYVYEKNIACIVLILSEDLDMRGSW